MRLLPTESPTISPSVPQMFYQFSFSSLSCPSAPSKSIPSAHMPHTITVSPKYCQMYTSLGTFLLLLFNLTNSLNQMLCYSGLAVIAQQSNVYKVEKYKTSHWCKVYTWSLQLLQALFSWQKNGTQRFGQIQSQIQFICHAINQVENTPQKV